MREAKDRSAQWMIEHHGDAIMRLAGVSGFSAWRPVRSVLTHPKLLPDGVLELTFPDEAEPATFLVEITTYPDREEHEQVLRDLAVVFLERNVVPDVVSLVLAPKGNLRLRGNYEQTSKRGLTRLGCQWHVVELWTVPAADLLALGDVGVLPWLPLTRFDGPPEVLLEQCPERIEQQAPPAERDNLLAVAATLAAFVYNDEDLISILIRSRAVQASPFLKKIGSSE